MSRKGFPGKPDSDGHLNSSHFMIQNLENMFEGWDRKKIPPPVSSYSKEDWTNPYQPDFGTKLLDIVDPERNRLHREQMQKILCIQSEDALTQFLNFNLGEPRAKPDIKTASKLFAELVESGFQIPAVIGAYHIYNLAQCACVLAQAQITARFRHKTRQDKFAAIALANDSLKTMDKLIKSATKFADKFYPRDKLKRSKQNPGMNAVQPSKSAPTFE